MLNVHQMTNLKNKSINTYCNNLCEICVMVAFSCQKNDSSRHKMVNNLIVPFYI